MSKILALQYPAAKLARLLAEQGYKIISLQEARQHRAHVDAILYFGHRPDTLTDCQETADFADVSLGAVAAADAAIDAVMLNISGMNAEQVAAELEYRLRPRNFRL